MVIEFNRTLDQELLAVMRGASLECLACGEFVMLVQGAVVCPECGSRCQRGPKATTHLVVTRMAERKLPPVRAGAGKLRKAVACRARPKPRPCPRRAPGPAASRRGSERYSPVERG